MATTLSNIIDRIHEKNPRHAKKIQQNLKGLGDRYFQKANTFYHQYEQFTQKAGKDLEYGVDSYLQMIADYIYEQIRFAQTGEYSCKSFSDANERVYNNPEVMDYYMHGLMLSQFLWRHHYELLEFFLREIHHYQGQVRAYLEVGGGHGWYLAEAMDILGREQIHYDLVDISPSSVEIAQGFLAGRPIRYFCEDIYRFEGDRTYDFITMGEVLEHVEDPVGLLRQLYRLLSEDGTVFITAPANAPAIDHIYLFRNAAEIEAVIKEAGFELVRSFSRYAEEVSQEQAEQLKVALMYGAFIQKQKN